MDNVTIRASLVNLINKHNTTTSTYDISSGLKERVKTIKGICRGGYKQPLPNIFYPAIYVELNNKDEAFATICHQGKKAVTLNYNITPVINVGYGNTDGRTISDDDLLKVSDNIETLIRNYPKLSITGVNVAEIVNTQYDVEESNDTWNSISKINLKIEMLTR